MERYVAGDSHAFDRLYARYAPRLLAAIRRGIGPGPSAQELVQQTFLQLHRARADYDSSRPFRPWVFTICFNLRREYHRRQSRRPETLLPPESMPEPSQAPLDLSRAERALGVRKALEELSSAQREVIELHWFQELPFKEVALIVGASETAVKVRAHRGYSRLRLHLASLEAHDKKRELAANEEHRRNFSPSSGILVPRDRPTDT